MKTPAEILMERSKAWSDILRPEQILGASKIKEPVVMDIGTIKMRSPAGYKTAITVSRSDSGSIDLHFSRTSEGEAFMRLPIFAAKQLGELLAKAVADDSSTPTERLP